MICTLDFTISANTGKATPEHESLKITKGLIYRVEFQFPAGCGGLVGIAVFDGGFQVWPSSLGHWFISDNFTIAFNDFYLKHTAPYQLDFYGYNLDETYDHTIYARIGLADQELYEAAFLPSLSYDQLVKKLEETELSEEAKRKAILNNPFPWVRR